MLYISLVVAERLDDLVGLRGIAAIRCNKATNLNTSMRLRGKSETFRMPRRTHESNGTLSGSIFMTRSQVVLSNGENGGGSYE